MYILLFKALHIIGFVAWFGGLFYLVRMFVYHVEAFDRPQPERDILTRQFNLMEWRVYRIICNPAIVITWLFGATIIYLYGWEWLQVNWWLQVKLVLLLGLSVYHFYCKSIIEKLEQGERAFSSFQFRLMNEVPTLFLVLICVLAVFKNGFNVWYTLLGMIAFVVLLFVGAKLYKQSREGK